MRRPGGHILADMRHTLGRDAVHLDGRFTYGTSEIPEERKDPGSISSEFQEYLKYLLLPNSLRSVCRSGRRCESRAGFRLNSVELSAASTFNCFREQAPRRSASLLRL